jgi:hypothetical protein
MYVKLRIALAGALTLFAASTQAREETPTSSGDYVLLSDAYGSAAYIGLPLMGRSAPDDPVTLLPAKAMAGEEISALFSKICLTKLFDRASYDAGLAALGPEFVSSPRALPDYAAPRPLIGVNKVAATQIVQERAGFGAASLWTGEGADQLKDRQVLRYSGSLVISGPVKPQDYYAPQCNLTLHVTALTSAKSLLDGIQTAAMGFKVVKRDEKPKYGYAVWTSAGPDGRVTRITADAERLNKPEQTVHVTVQLLPPGKTK